MTAQLWYFRTRCNYDYEQQNPLDHGMSTTRKSIHLREPHQFIPAIILKQFVTRLGPGRLIISFMLFQTVYHPTRTRSFDSSLLCHSKQFVIRLGLGRLMILHVFFRLFIISTRTRSIDNFFILFPDGNEQRRRRVPRRLVA